MVQARIFRKHNLGSHYCNAICNFMKERAIAHKDISTFFSADAKSKVSFGKLNFPIATVIGVGR